MHQLPKLSDIAPSSINLDTSTSAGSDGSESRANVEPNAKFSISDSDALDGLDALDASPEGCDVLDELSDWFRRHIRARLDSAYDLLALWVLHTHLMSLWWSTPRLFVTSALPGCGKTTVLDNLERLTPNPMLGSQATPALIARVVSAQQTTVLLDETDNLLSKRKDGTPDLLATLNSGYRRGGNRPVLVPKKGGEWEAKSMSTFAAVALAGIGDHLPDAVLTRSIVLRLDKAINGEVAHSDWRKIEPVAHALRDRTANWAERHQEALRTFISITDTPDDLHGRDLEVWEPIYMLGQYVGGEWASRAEACRLDFIRERDLDASVGRTERPGLRLLRATQEVWPETELFISTSELIERLAVHDPDQWGEDAPYGRIKAKRLANLLVEFGARAEHSADRTCRGYYRKHFERAWTTYTPADASKASNPSKASGTCQRCHQPLAVADTLAGSATCQDCDIEEGTG